MNKVHSCDSYIFEKVRTMQLFWCVNEVNSLKNEKVMVLFVKSLWCVFFFAIVLTFPWKPSCSLHRSFWNSSGRGSSPRNICDLNPLSPLPLNLRNRSNNLLALRCQPSRHFLFKDKLQSKNAGKVKVLICWHHVTLSVDRSTFCQQQTFKFCPTLP